MIKSVLCILTLTAFVFSVSGQRRSRNSPPVKSSKASKPVQPTPVDPFSIPPPPPASKPTPNPEDEVVRVETNLVTTPVSVLDRNGRFIPGLRKKDFKIFENGIPQAITYFQSSEQPFTVVLMIDTSPSTRYHIDEIHYAAVTFVNQLRPTDKVMVMSFDSRLRILSEPTTEKQKIFAAIYKAQFGSGTSLYDSVDYVTELDLVRALGRKAVVIFTDGVDTTSRQASFESTAAAVEEVDALFYPIRYNTQRPSGAAAAAVAAAGVWDPISNWNDGPARSWPKRCGIPEGQNLSGNAGDKYRRANVRSGHDLEPRGCIRRRRRRATPTVFDRLLRIRGR